MAAKSKLFSFYSITIAESPNEIRDLFGVVENFPSTKSVAWALESNQSKVLTMWLLIMLSQCSPFPSLNILIHTMGDKNSIQAALSWKWHSADKALSKVPWYTARTISVITSEWYLCSQGSRLPTTWGSSLWKRCLCRWGIQFQWAEREFLGEVYESVV